MAAPAVWDRREDESAKAYDAFTRYRDLGPSRSVDEAFRLTKPGHTGRASSHWERWAKLHDWRIRAEAYDAHLERQARRERERARVGDIEAFRERQRAIAQRQHEIASELHEQAAASLQKWKEREHAIAYTPVIVADLAAAAAKIAESATNTEALALGIDILLREMKNDA